MISYLLGSDFFEFAKQIFMALVPLLALVAIGISLKNGLMGAGAAAKGLGGGIGDALGGVGKALDGAGSGAGKAASGAGSGMSKIASGGGSGVGKAVKGIGQGIGGNSGLLGGVANLGGKAIGGTAKLAGKAVKGTAKLGGKAALGTAKLAGKGIKAAASKGKQKASQAASGARERASGARDNMRRKAWEMGEQAAGRSGTGTDYETWKTQDQKATRKAARAYSADGLIEIAQTDSKNLEEVEARLRAADIFYTVDWDIDEYGNEVFSIRIREDDEDIVIEELEILEEEMTQGPCCPICDAPNHEDRICRKCYEEEFEEFEQCTGCGLQAGCIEGLCIQCREPLENTDVEEPDYDSSLNWQSEEEPKEPDNFDWLDEELERLDELDDLA